MPRQIFTAAKLKIGPAILRQHPRKPPIKPPRPTYASRDGRIKLYNADSLDILDQLAPESIDLVQADPPYSSGGLHKSSRSADPLEKYLGTDKHIATNYRTFSGDQRDQRSWAFWSTLWMSRAVDLLKIGGHLQVFTDWRQMPTTTDVMQGAGAVWRGVIPWDKGRGSRSPHTGYHRHQCEYAIWGTKGPALKAPGRGPFVGIVAQPIERQKLHPTAKPPAMLQELQVACPEGGVVLDPFMGSGSAGVAALRGGRSFIGIEKDPHHFEVAKQRLVAAAAECQTERLAA